MIWLVWAIGRSALVAAIKLVQYTTFGRFFTQTSADYGPRDPISLLDLPAQQLGPEINHQTEGEHSFDSNYDAGITRTNQTGEPA